jgi:hypothetical protein
LDLQQLLSELVITMADPDALQAIALALLLGGVVWAFGVWLSRTIGLLDRGDPAGEILGVGLATGLLVAASWWAAVWSGARSSFAPVAVGFGLSLVLALAHRRRNVPPPTKATFEQARGNEAPRETGTGWIPRRSLVGAILGGAVFVVTIGLLYGSTFTTSPRDGAQPIERIDTSFYAVLGRDLATTGTETNTLPSGFTNLPGDSPQTWYHWGEIWLASAVIAVFGTAPLAARHLVVLPLVLLATAALTGTLARRGVRHEARLTFLLGGLACLVLAPLPLIPGPFFSAWATGLISSIAVFGLAAVAVTFALYLILVLGRRQPSWALASFAGTAFATVLPAHIVVALLAVVGVGAASSAYVGWTVARTGRLPAVPTIWRRTFLTTTVAVTATVLWGVVTEHGLGLGGGLTELKPFNSSWRDTVGIVAAQAGILLVPFGAWLVLRRDAPRFAAICVGTSALIVAGAIVWGWRLATFNMFYFFFAGIALIGTPVAIVAVVMIVDRFRTSARRPLILVAITLGVLQLELGTVSALGRIQLASSTYAPIPLGVFQAIGNLPSTAKLAYACQPLEEISFVNSKLLGIDAHTGRRVVPMCFEADAVGPLLGLERSTERPDAGFAFAPQSAVYPDSTTRPSVEEVVAFLKAHGIDYIYADATHPNSLVPDAVPIAAEGAFQLLRVP